MNNVKKLMKFYGVILGSILIGLFLLTLLYHFNIIGKSFMNYARYILLLMIMFIGSYKVGKNTSKNGWLAGLRFGFLFDLFFFIFSFLAFHQGLRLRIIIYYIIILITTILGSMIGINKNEKK